MQTRDKMKVRILSPMDCLEFEADAVFLPGEQCPFEVRPAHAAIISTLSAGQIRWRSAGEEKSLSISGGVARLSGGLLNICTQ